MCLAVTGVCHRLALCCVACGRLAKSQTTRSPEWFYQICGAVVACGGCSASLKSENAPLLPQAPDRPGPQPFNIGLL